MSDYKKERRKEKRYPCQTQCAIYLSHDDGEEMTSPAGLQGRLHDISISGAAITLPAIIIDRLHLAYASQESNDLTLYLSCPLSPEQNISIPCQVRWYNKKLSPNTHPFILGLKFNLPLTTSQLNAIRSQAA